MDAFVVGVLSSVASTVLSSALSKLGRVINELLSPGEAAWADATIIETELVFIQDTIRKNSSLVDSQSLWIGLLRRLAYQIEDCIDCFQVEKTTREQFAAEVVQLREVSKNTREQIEFYVPRDDRNPTRAQGQGQQSVAAATFDHGVPREILELLGEQREQDRFDYLNRLLYFYMFPHDHHVRHHVRRNPLIRRWLAEGLVQDEEAAATYLETLISRKIIDTIARSNNGMVKTCQPPVEIRQFIKEQSRSTDFMLLLDDLGTLQAGRARRRLSLHPSIPNQRQQGGLNLPDFPNLHTLAAFCGRANPRCYRAILRPGKKLEIKYEVLRVLDLKECAPLYKRDLLAICKLVLLKYLSFQIHSNNPHLLREMKNLKWLETLDLRGSQTVTVCKEVLMIPKLKHLLGKFQLSRWRTSFNVPSRTLFESNTEDLREFLENWSAIETLSGFVISTRLGFPQLMKLMGNLKKVKIWCQSNASDRNLHDVSSAIEEFIRAETQHPAGRSLCIDFKDCPRQFLNTIQVEGSLNTLKLRGNLGGFSQFSARDTGIEELCLSSTALSWVEILAGLSNLQILKYLKLVEDSLSVEIPPQRVQSLERICFVGVQRLDITIQAGALPNLVSLDLICQDLRVVPGTPHMEITGMTCLQEVGLHPQVDPTTRLGWENAARAHRNTPRVFEVQGSSVDP